MGVGERHDGAVGDHAIDDAVGEAVGRQLQPLSQSLSPHPHLWLKHHLPLSQKHLLKLQVMPGLSPVRSQETVYDLAVEWKSQRVN